MLTTRIIGIKNDIIGNISLYLLSRLYYKLSRVKIEIFISIYNFRGAPSTMVKRSESVQHESSTGYRRLSNIHKDQPKGNFELRNVCQNHHLKTNKINGNRTIHESTFLSHNDKGKERYVEQGMNLNCAV